MAGLSKENGARGINGQLVIKTMTGPSTHQALAHLVKNLLTHTSSEEDTTGLMASTRH